jgi:hypothetical protein
LEGERVENPQGKGFGPRLGEHDKEFEELDQGIQQGPSVDGLRPRIWRRQVQHISGVMVVVGDICVWILSVHNLIRIMVVRADAVVTTARVKSISYARIGVAS